MKGYYQSDEDLALEVEQIEHELAALEISLKRKRLHLRNRRSEQQPTSPTQRIPLGVEDKYHQQLHIDDQVKVLNSSKNNKFIGGVTEAIVTGLTPKKEVKVTDITNPDNQTWRAPANLQKIE